MNALSNNFNYNSPQFEKIVIKPNDKLPTDSNGIPLDLRGCVAITTNNEPHAKRSLLHNLIIIFQKIHAFFGRTRFPKENFIHGMIVLGHSENNHSLKIAHSGLSKGINNTTLNLFPRSSTKQWTSLVIYRPVDKKLREIFAHFGEQTAFSDKSNFPHKKRPAFSISSMIQSTLFHSSTRFKDKRIQKRVASVVADLLLNNQIFNRASKLKSYYCMSYVISVLQGSRIISNLDEASIDSILFASHKLNSRKDIIEKIYNLIHDPMGNQLSSFFWNDPLCRINGKFALSYQTGKILDQLSQSK